MSKEFNYKRAWDQYVKPEFEKLPVVGNTRLKTVLKGALNDL